jgi:hypothetical protein
VLNALPRNHDHVQHIANNSSIQSLHHDDNHHNRFLEELYATGRCLDNIQPKESTLLHGGRGAFATRDVPKGSIVTGSPLIHVRSEELAYMYHSHCNHDEGAYVRDLDSFVGYQLWYKYCMGHAGVNSSILLCPYGSGVNYMNHNESLTNVKLQCAPHGIVGHNNTWRN